MKLTESNYYSNEAGMQWMSVSQYKAFAKCAAKAMAELKGLYVPEKSRSLLLGSYVDEALTGTADSFAAFCEEHHEDLYQKRGDKKLADVIQADEAIRRVKEQPLMMKYLGGEHQTIMTGEIAGVPFKGKFDSYKPGEFIADLKYVRSLRSPNLFENVIDYWKYTTQMAVYQELVYQNTGERLRCFIVAVTKENPAHVTVCEIDQFTLDSELEEVKRLAPHFQKIKNGEIPSERCDCYDCAYCTETKVLEEPVPYELITMSADQLKAMRGDI